MIPNGAYVSSFLMAKQQELEGFHIKLNEIELLRYGEEKIGLPAGEKPSGLEVRTLMLSDLVESVKAAITANSPKTTIRATDSQSQDAQENASKREKFWNAYLSKINRPVPVLSEFADSSVSLGFGILKGAVTPWPTKDRRRKPDEKKGTKDGDKKYLARMKALKRKWGLPITVTAVHPLTYYFQRGIGNKVVESVEHSWRPKVEMYAAYGVNDADGMNTKAKSGRGMNFDTDAFGDKYNQIRAEAYRSITGQPEELVRSLPYGSDTTTMSLVSEYLNDYCYQVYVDHQLIYEQTNPDVGYFIALGRTSISSDIDKLGLSVGDNLRHIEPIINRTLTRMGEGIELTVRKRLAAQQDSGTGLVGTGLPGTPAVGDDNDPMKSWQTYEPGKMKLLPPGVQPVDLFEGADKVFAAMPYVQLLFDVANQHGVAPIFKGMPPGASGSGYRDNSLYLMAKSQFNYLVESHEEALTELIQWCERMIVERINETVYIDDLELSPSDIEDFPAIVEVKLDPALPQNKIAEAQLYMQAHKEGYGDREWVYQNGFKEEQSEELEKRRLLEKAMEVMEESLIIEAFRRVGVIPGFEQPGGGGGGSGLVDKNGQPMAPSQPSGPGGAQQLLAGGSAGGRGQSQPPYLPGTSPPSGGP